MNERIRELYEQAHEEQSPISGQGRLTKDILWEQPKKFNPEKFAELIVKECLDRIKNADMTDLEGSDPDDVLWLVERQIVKHFGVEE